MPRHPAFCPFQRYSVGPIRVLVCILMPCAFDPTSWGKSEYWVVNIYGCSWKNISAKFQLHQNSKNTWIEDFSWVRCTRRHARNPVYENQFFFAPFFTDDNFCRPSKPPGSIEYWKASKINGTRGLKGSEGPKRLVSLKAQGWPFKASLLNSSWLQRFLERP